MVDLPATHYSDMTYSRVPWRRSLFSKIFMAFVAITLPLTFFAVLFTALLHQRALESLVPQGDLLAVQQRVITDMFLLGIFAIILTGIAAFFLSRHLTRPIQKLMVAMEKVSHDDINVRMDIRQKDEIGQLAHFFNSMMRKLVEVHERNQAIQALKSQFVSEAAHQLRTPLTGLRWSLEYLLAGKGGDITSKQQQTLQRGIIAAERMKTLVNQFLDVSKLEEGNFGLNLQAVAIVELFSDVAAEYKDKAQNHQLSWEFVSDVDKRIKLVADPDHVRSALTNVLDNALLYTKPGGSITVHLTADHTYLQVTVTDTGVGIPRSDQGKIFNKFHRADNAKKLQTEGSGLGLFIARNIIRRHGGKMWFESQENKGSVFHLTLPLHEELLPKAETLEDLLREI